jgi:N-acetylmuramoyl-L-alanine amidase
MLGGTGAASGAVSPRICCLIVSIAALSLLPIGMNDAVWSRDLVHVSPKLDTELEPTATKHAALGCDESRFRIILDVGHTSEAQGAISARNVPEFDFNLQLARKIEENLKSEGFVRAVLKVTDGKARPSLFKRVAAANKSGADLFLSIHHDSVPDSFLQDWEFEGQKSHFNDRFSGYSLFVSRRNPEFKTSLAFARLVGRQLKAEGQHYATQYTERFMGRYRHQLLDKEVGVYRYDQLIVLRLTRMPAVLLEAGSIINRDEEAQMKTPERQSLITTAVTAAVKDFCQTLSSRGKLAKRDLSHPASN